MGARHRRPAARSRSRQGGGRIGAQGYPGVAPHWRVLETTMARETLPYAEVLEKVQNLLLGCQDCRNVSVDALLVGDAADGGVNWLVAGFRLSGHDNDLPACRQLIIGDVRQLRESYDVDPGSPR